MALIQNPICMHADRFPAAAACRRTLKFLTGVLQGRWVVAAAWAAACQSVLGPVSEEAFEISKDSSGGESAAILGRENCLQGVRLLAGYQVTIGGLTLVSMPTTLQMALLLK